MVGLYHPVYGVPGLGQYTSSSFTTAGIVPKLES
jgi:hypothetical protein